MSDRFDTVFASIPDDIRERLNKHYHEIKHNFALRKFEPSELNGGKFCEDVFRILEWHSNNAGKFTPYGRQIKNFKRSVRDFENMSSLDDSVRFHIPDVLCAIYNVRNKRGVSHSPGVIDPNFMDATLVASCVDWVMAELVRLFHNVSVEEAKNMVESVVTKQIPLIWRIEDRTRVISPPGATLSYDKKVLVVLYSHHPEPITVDDLFLWTRHSNKSVFRNKLLGKLDHSDMIDVEPGTDLVRLSLLGVSHVEKHIPLDFEYS